MKTIIVFIKEGIFFSGRHKIASEKKKMGKTEKIFEERPLFLFSKLIVIVIRGVDVVEKWDKSSWRRLFSRWKKLGKKKNVFPILPSFFHTAKLSNIFPEEKRKVLSTFVQKSGEK